MYIKKNVRFLFRWKVDINKVIRVSKAFRLKWGFGLQDFLINYGWFYFILLPFFLVECKLFACGWSTWVSHYELRLKWTCRTPTKFLEMNFFSFSVFKATAALSNLKSNFNKQKLHQKFSTFAVSSVFAQWNI